MANKTRLTISILLGTSMVGCDFEDAAPPAETDATKIAQGRFVPAREDDFAWENDKVAFRVYGPASPAEGPISGVDAWFKKVDYPIIDKWYAENAQGISYHEDQGEGYDRYHTGTSRGVGGTAIWHDGVPYPAASFDSYEIQQSGDNVVEFTLQYAWDTPLGTVTESKTISLETGRQLYEVASEFMLNGERVAIPVAIGLTTHDEAAAVFSSDGGSRISTWETIDQQGVGTGVLLSGNEPREVVHIQSDEADASHIWLITSTNNSGELRYRAGFTWAAAGEIMSVEEWNDYLDKVLAEKTR